MVKPSAFVKMSGSLVKNPAVIGWLKWLGEIYFVVVCIGGGEQINKAFKERGWPINFGPLGRITLTVEEKRLARDVLEQNQDVVQDQLDAAGVHARVIIPVEDIGGVLCHVNGDVLLLAAYLGFDKLFILTAESQVETKKLWLKDVVKVFEAIEKGDLDKIEVVGF
jgi:hypothetical protein